MLDTFQGWREGVVKVKKAVQHPVLGVEEVEVRCVSVADARHHAMSRGNRWNCSSRSQSTVRVMVAVRVGVKEA